KNFYLILADALKRRSGGSRAFALAPLPPAAPSSPPMRSPDPSQLAELRRRLAELAALEEVLGVLAWDQEVVMPEGAAAARGRQVATVALVHHERLVDPELGALLEGLAAAELGPVDAANVALGRRDHLRARRVPAALVE